MRALVTGANGFVGSWLVRTLLERGDEPLAMVRASSDRSLLGDLDLEYVVADTTLPETLPAALAGVDIVYHLAAALEASDQAGFDRVNVTGTGNLVQAVLDHRPEIHRFVLVSSMAAAGPARPNSARTEDEPAAPVSCYGRSKLGGERTLDRFDGSPPCTIVRPPIVFGPAGQSMVALFRSVQRHLIAEVAGTGRPASFIDVRDLVRGIVLAGTRPEAEQQTFHLVGPEDGTLGDFQRIIADELGVGALTLALPEAVLKGVGQATDLWKRTSGRRFPFGRDKVAEATAPSWVMDGAKARRSLGFDARIGWREGIRDSIADYRQRGWMR